MAADPTDQVADPLERRYLALARLSPEVAAATSWPMLAATVGRALGEGPDPAPVRIWSPDQSGEPRTVAAYPHEFEWPEDPERARLSSACDLPEPSRGCAGSLLAPLRSDGTLFGIAEVGGGFADLELLRIVAPVVAGRAASLDPEAADGGHYPPEEPGAGDIGTVMAEFAHEAQRLLNHDRLSAYLLTPGGAFERFAVAGSPALAGEGVLIPYNEVGLRHVIETNRALVSSDLTTDPRIVGREDRVIARAGYHGLLSVPLRHTGRPFGVLNFVSRRPAFYSEGDIPVAEQIAAQIGVFIENLRAQQRARTHLRQQAAEQERARVSRDLYQAANESVAKICELADGLAEQFGPDQEQLRVRAREITAVAELELAEMRRAVADLSPRAMDRKSLAQLIESSAQNLRDLGGIELKQRLSGDLESLPQAQRRGIYRIVQEALNNVRLHSQAGRATLEIELGRDLDLTIEDDGTGFDPEAGAGLGIMHMRERADAMGGYLTIASAPEQGTTIHFSLSSPRSQPATELTPSDSVSSRVRPSIRLLVVESSALIRAGLVHTLESGESLRVVGDAPDPELTAPRLRQLHPDVILIRGNYSEQSLGALCKAVARHSPSAALLLLGEVPIDLENELLAEGFSGILDLDPNPEEIFRAIEVVSSGAQLITRHGESESGTAEHGLPLGKRERTIIGLVAAGETNAEIGRSMFLATKTVERQVATITRKLGARNRAHASAIAVARKIVPPPNLPG